MRAVRVEAFGEPFRTVPDAPEPDVAEGEVLVAIEAAAVGHLDVQIAAGVFPLSPALPYVPGTDAAGRVLAGGTLAPGTPVFVRGEGVGVVRGGCWAERASLPAAAVHELPDGLDPALAATFFVPCSTALVAVHDVGELEPGERVAVRGAVGAVGSIAVQLALAAGAGEVIAIVRREEDVALLPEGVRAVVAPGLQQLAGLQGAEIDLLVDTVGGDGLPASLPALRPGGRIALVGYLAGTAVTFELPKLLAQDVRLLPVSLLRRGEDVLPRVPSLVERLRGGELRLATAAFPLERLGEAVAALAPGGFRGRVALTF